MLFSQWGAKQYALRCIQGCLAVELEGVVTLYDTLNHHIGGVSQQQGGDTSLCFSSQYGTITVSSLPIISGPGLPTPTNFATAPSPVFDQQATIPLQDQPSDVGDAFELLEKLARLRDAGAINPDDFEAKKADLLSRI